MNLAKNLEELREHLAKGGKAWGWLKGANRHVEAVVDQWLKIEGLQCGYSFHEGQWSLVPLDHPWCARSVDEIRAHLAKGGKVIGLYPNASDDPVEVIEVKDTEIVGKLSFDFSRLRWELVPVPPVRQYYYRVDGCQAEHCHDPDCICWHDEGTGPLKTPPEDRRLHWRTKPDANSHRTTP